MSDSESKTTPPADAPGEGHSLRVLRRTLWWVVGIAAVSAVVAYTVVRMTSIRRPPDDPTSERIQTLIDEANRLLRTLDDKKRP